jgi:hypothetical protein
MRQIQVVKLGDFYMPDIQSALSCLSDSQYCTFMLNKQYVPIPDADYRIANLIEEYSFEQLKKVLNEYRESQKISNEVILIGIINRSIERNYFSFTDSLSKCAVITIKDLEKLLESTTIEEFLICEIAEHAVATIEDHYWHEEPRRCLFDFCGDKRDIIPSMSYRALCESCYSRLSQEAIELLQRSFDCIEKIDPITKISQEIKKMAEEPQRIIHTQSYFEQGTHTHTHNYAPEQNLPKAAAEIQQLLAQLQQAYPEDIGSAVREEIKRNPNFRDRLRNAFKEGGLETLKVLFAPLGIPIEFVRGWIEAEAQPIEDDWA